MILPNVVQEMIDASSGSATVDLALLKAESGDLSRCAKLRNACGRRRPLAHLGRVYEAALNQFSACLH